MCTILHLRVMGGATTHIMLLKKNQCPYEHPWLWTNNSSATPSPPPPPPALVDNIVGSDTHALESAVSSSGLHGAHRCVAASLSLLVVIDATCINSHITSNKKKTSFNNVDLSYMMLVDCCVLCCRGCGPIAAV
jgi:hypothetical protein